MGVCNCSMFCCMLLCVHSSIAIILMGKRELIALLNLSSWCLVVVGRLFLAVPRGCLQFVIVVFPDHTHLLFLELMKDGAHKRYYFMTSLYVDTMSNAIKYYRHIHVNRKCSFHRHSPFNDLRFYNKLRYGQY